MDASDYKLVALLDRIYLNDFCCPIPLKWANLSNHVCSTIGDARPTIRYPPSLILGGWVESPDIEKRHRLFEQLLFAYRHGAIEVASDYLMSLNDDDWHEMSG